MPHPVWPLFDLVVRRPRLELRYVDEALATSLALLAAAGVHPPDAMPFSVPWTRPAPGGELERGVLQHHWRTRAAHAADDWHLPFGVLLDGEVVGRSARAGVRAPRRGRGDHGLLGRRPRVVRRHLEARLRGERL